MAKLANVMTLVPRRSDKNPRKASQDHALEYDDMISAYRKMVGKRPLQHLARISDLRLEHSSGMCSPQRLGVSIKALSV